MEAHFDCMSADDVPELIRFGGQVFIPSTSGPTAHDENAAFPRFSSFTHEVKNE
jgi:hypothetical protein